jgi:hypothetical protein
VLAPCPDCNATRRSEGQSNVALPEAARQIRAEPSAEEATEPSLELAAWLVAAAAAAEAARLRERVRLLESRLELASKWRRVEYVQARRLALMRAVRRDERYSFVHSLPHLLLVVYDVVSVLLLAWLVTRH